MRGEITDVMDDYKDAWRNLDPQDPRIPQTQRPPVPPEVPEQNGMNGTPLYRQPKYTEPPPSYGSQYTGPGMVFQMTPPPPPPPQAQPMNKRILVAAWVIAALIFLLCVFCIGADLLHGAMQGDAGEGSRVVIEMQEPPELDADDENVSADGTYTVRGVAELVSPCIVKVGTFSETEDGDTAVGTGSGIVLTEDGYIITNAHVVQGDHFVVEIDEDEDYEAELIGSDTKTDLAVLKIDAKGLAYAVIGDSETVQVGDDVVAIGNPAGLTDTVTKGIVSAIGRQVRADSASFAMECIQTDAAISPGNSGGALVNMYGQVVGITSSKYASAYSTTYEGLGFAISTGEAMPVIQDLIDQGYVSGRYRIGITFVSTNSEYGKYEYEQENDTALPEELEGCLWITDIDSSCDIASTQLESGDFILRLNGERVSEYDDVRDALDGCKGGDSVKAECARIKDGEVQYYNITFKLEEDTSGNF